MISLASKSQRRPLTWIPPPITFISQIFWSGRHTSRSCHTFLEKQGSMPLLCNSLDLQIWEILSKCYRGRCFSQKVGLYDCPSNFIHFLWLCERKNSNPHKDRKKKSIQETDTLNNMPLFHDMSLKKSFLILCFPYSSKYCQVWVKLLKMKSLKVTVYGEKEQEQTLERNEQHSSSSFDLLVKTRIQTWGGNIHAEQNRKNVGKNMEKLRRNF